MFSSRRPLAVGKPKGLQLTLEIRDVQLGGHPRVLPRLDGVLLRGKSERVAHSADDLNFVGGDGVAVLPCVF